MALRIIVTVGCALVVGSCTRDDGYGPIEEYARVLSPDGEVNAFVYHYDSPSGGLTQIVLDFVGLGCGAGSASWHEYNIGVELHWIDSDTLEVSYPDGKPYSHNASGSLLGCYDRAVRVVMVPHGVSSASDGTYSMPTESGHTVSPNSEANAYTFRYDSPQGGITQVVVAFPEFRGCTEGAVTFYDSEIDLQLSWIDLATLEVGYPDGRRYDHPPWGPMVRCLDQSVQVRMQTATDPNESLSIQE